MQKLFLYLVLIFSASVAYPFPYLTCEDYSSMGEPGTKPQGRKFEIRLPYLAGTTHPLSYIEELFLGAAPESRYYQVLGTLSLGKWPLGTYIGSSQFGDIIIINILRSTKSSASSGHGGHEGMPMPTPIPSSSPSPAAEVYAGTYSYFIGSFHGLLPIRCQKKEQGN